MSLPKTIGFVTVVALLVGMAADTASAQEASEGAVTNLPTALSTELKSEEMVGLQPVQRAYVTFGTNRFAFVVPYGYRMDASNPEKIALFNADYSSYIVFRVAEPLTYAARELPSTTYREVVLARYPNAKILDEFTQRAANHSGPAFDVQWTNSAHITQFTRVAFIPSAAGVLEFSLVSNAGKFTEGQYFLSYVMLSFRTNEGGKLIISRLSDKY
jgi:hypothetical protein